jgi:hydrogenase maturation protease HycI
MISNIDRFKRLLKGKILFLGIGNSLKSDDAAGLVLLEKLRKTSFVSSLNAEFWNCSSSPENYLEKIVKQDFDTVIIIDALSMEKQAGSIDFVNPRYISSFSVSTHSLSVSMFVDYLKSNKQIDIYLLGIQTSTTQTGEGLSPEVSASIDEFINNLSY